jgi:hypothetical protein
MRPGIFDRPMAAIYSFAGPLYPGQSPGRLRIKLSAHHTRRLDECRESA